MLLWHCSETLEPINLNHWIVKFTDKKGKGFVPHKYCHVDV